MSGEEQTSRIAVLLFTDMVESVALERRLGTEAYSRLLVKHHELFRQAMTAVGGGGKIHLDTGDGFLSEFSTAAGAVNAALLFQLLLRETKWDTDAPKVRIGLHQGQLAEIRPDPTSVGKIVGIPVSIASRVMNLARPGQILMTRPVYDDARQFIREHPSVPDCRPPALKWKAHGPYLFKGSEEPTEIFEVGASGYAPLSAPLNSEKGRRATQPEETAPQLRPARRPVLGAALTALCGLLLLTPIGDPWINASYDYLFKFGARLPAKNNVALVLMDNAACDTLGQTRNTWDRALHTEMLNKLTDAGASIVAFDILFREARSKEGDAALAAAMRRHGKVVLMSKVSDPRHPGWGTAQILQPNPVFMAAATNGICDAGVPELDTPRQHFPYPALNDERYRTLPELTAQLAGAPLDNLSARRWLRYYGQRGPWEAFSYHYALSNAPACFRGRIVFIGNKPRDNNPSLGEEDKFCTPYTRWSGQSVGGIEIMATTFLNLVNGDWLWRLHWVLESLLLIATGGLLGWGAYLCSRPQLLGLSALLAVTVALGGICLSYVTNLWFPWLIIAGGQIPFAVAWGWAATAVRVPTTTSSGWEPVTEQPVPAPAALVAAARDPLPDAPEYELFDPPFGEGGFGKVWLARNAVGQWQALKAVYQAKFGKDTGPYEAEFNGLQRYKPVSERHPGLLRIDLVSRKKGEGYFYYIMELGDSLYPGWEQTPARYKPKDLEAARRLAFGHRLPVAECLRIAIALADALDFLHRQGLTHRDIKPSNIIFVGGRPKLADVGLVTELRPAESPRTAVGTIGFIPPTPERAGTAQADIYSLGMVLYVISTGRDPDTFPDLSTTLMDRTGHIDFIRLNAVILKACHPDSAQRYQTAADMLHALQEAHRALA